MKVNGEPTGCSQSNKPRPACNYLKRSLAAAKDDQRIRLQITIDSVHMLALGLTKLKSHREPRFKQLNESQLVQIQDILKSFRQQEAWR